MRLSAGPDKCDIGGERPDSGGMSEISVEFTAQDVAACFKSQPRKLADSASAHDPHSLIGRTGRASAKTVRLAIRSRSQRNKFFAADLFADPAWDMLLDLYLSQIIERRVSVSSLCLASNVPCTTALRWITTLQNEKLIKRNRDPFDKRRWYMSLTGKARFALDLYFSRVAAADLSSEN